MSVLTILLVAALLSTPSATIDGTSSLYRLTAVLIFAPTAVGYAVYFLRGAQTTQLEFRAIGRYSAWLVLGISVLIILNQIGLVGEIDPGAHPLHEKLIELCIALFAWACILAFSFKRAKALDFGGDGVLAAIYCVVISIHNVPEGLALGSVLAAHDSPGVTGSPHIGLLAALTLQNVVDAIIAGAVVLTKRISLLVKTLYLLVLPVVECICAMLALGRPTGLESMSGGALTFAAAGMFVVAVAEIITRHRAD